MTRTKKIILLLLLLPNLVMAESYLCVTENATGFTYNLDNQTYKSVSFKNGSKYIVKKVGGEWKAMPFGTQADSFLNMGTKCKETIDHDGLVGPKGALASINCDKYGGTFKFALYKMRFQNFNSGSWLKPTAKGEMYSDPAIEIGSCSSI